MPAIRARQRKRNPPVLVTFANPGKKRQLLSRRVEELRYRHAADGKYYRHPFGPSVCAELLPDGSVRLYHETGKPLFQWFPD